MEKLLGGALCETITPSLLPADVMVLRKSERQWELMSPPLAPDDVVKLRIAATEWNKGTKYRPYGELFFFLMQKEPYETSGDFASTPFEVHDFMRVLEQVSGSL